MIFDKKEVKKVIKYCLEHHPEWTYHLNSKLTCLKYERQIIRCSKLIPKNAKVLDLGCGLGHISMGLSVIRPDLDILGVDRNKAQLWNMIIKKFKCKFKVEDALNLTFKNNTFDAIISFGVMEHTNNDKKFLSECYRVLKKNGVIIIVNLPSKHSMNEFIAKIFIKVHDNMYTKRKIKKLFYNTGFKDTKINIEFFLPSQVNEVSDILGRFWNKHYIFFDKLDLLLIKTPLKFFAQSYSIICKK